MIIHLSDRPSVIRIAEGLLLYHILHKGSKISLLKDIIFPLTGQKIIEISNGVFAGKYEIPLNK